MSSVFTFRKDPSLEIKKSAPSFNIFQKSREPEPEKIQSTSNEESTPQKVLRGVARTGTDILQTVAGTPGGLLSLANEGTGRLSSAITGKKFVPYEELPIAKVLPTQSMLQKGNSEYLKPQSESEETGSEFIQDLTSLLIPIPGKKHAKIAVKSLDFLKRLGKRIYKSAAVVGTATGAEKLAKEMGVSEETARGIKTGLTVAGGLGLEGGRGGAEKYKKSLYEKMKSTRPQDASMVATNLRRQARSLQRLIKSGGSSESSTKSLKKIDEILDSIKSGQGNISIKELEDFGVKLNEAKASLYQDFQVDKVGRRVAKKNLNDVTKLVEGALEEYGKSNKPYTVARKEAKQAHMAIEKGKEAQRWLQDIGKKFGQHGLTAAVVGAITNPSAIIPTGVGALATYSGLKGSELVIRMIKSPKLREYYLNVLDGSLRKDAQFVSHNLQKIEKILEEDPNALLED